MLAFISVIIIISSESGSCSGFMTDGSVPKRHDLSDALLHIGWNCARNTTINVCNLGFAINLIS